MPIKNRSISDSDRSVSDRWAELRAKILVAFQVVMVFKLPDSNNLRRALPVTFILMLVIGIFFEQGDIFQAASASSEAATSQKDEVNQFESFLPDGFELPLFPLYFDSVPGIIRKLDIHTVIPERPRLAVLSYVVKEGDTLFAIAGAFNLNPETILWGNFAVLQDNPHSLRPGQELNILPVDGTYYEWIAGDGLITVADYFDVSLQNIIDWPGNNLPPDLNPSNPPIDPGTFLVIPGGSREFTSWNAPRITRTNPAVAKIAGPGACGSIYDGPIGEGYFIWPTPSNFLSGNDYSDYHPGIDIAGSIGNAIYASASGVVVYAGWNYYGYGYMIVIDHGEGWQTLYAHMSQVGVVCGQAVFQGNVIGGVGSSGNSTGPHLHFEMQSDFYGKVNPYSFISP